jgi:hypothetical protein
MFSTLWVLTARDFVTQIAAQPLAILSRVLTFVCLVVPNGTSCRGTHSAMTSHMTRDATGYRTFNASLGIC